MNDTLSHIEKHSNKEKEDNVSNDLTTMTEAIEKNDFQVAVLDLNKKGVIFSRNVRCSIFFIILLTNLIINMDHGTIPSATSEIKSDLDIDDGSLGIFGSLVYLGNILGTFKFLIRGRHLHECHARYQPQMGHYWESIYDHGAYLSLCGD